MSMVTSASPWQQPGRPLRLDDLLTAWRQALTAGNAPARSAPPGADPAGPGIQVRFSDGIRVVRGDGPLWAAFQALRRQLAGRPGTFQEAATRLALLIELACTHPAALAPWLRVTRGAFVLDDALLRAATTTPIDMLPDGRIGFEPARLCAVAGRLASAEPGSGCESSRRPAP